MVSKKLRNAMRHFRWSIMRDRAAVIEEAKSEIVKGNFEVI